MADNPLLKELGVPEPFRKHARVTMTEEWVVAAYEAGGELVVKAKRLDDMPMQHISPSYNNSHNRATVRFHQSTDRLPNGRHKLPR